jgi:uncharacterized protein (DUF58 family)
VIPMVHGRPANELFIATLFLLLGVLLGNMVLAMLSLPVFFYMIFAGTDRRITSQFLSEGMKNIKVKVGTTVTIAHKIATNGSPGLLIAHDNLHERFTLKEGNSIGVFWKDRGSIELKHTYQIVPVRQGLNEVGPTKVETWDAYGLSRGRMQSPGNGVIVQAEARVRDVRKLRDRRSIMMLPMPVGHQSVLGTETTDFKEIREYRRGEAFRRVNWKASARRQRAGVFKPFVNEYEREGKRKVWIFLDCGRHMEVGGQMESAMEHAGNAARIISDLYLAADCMVGMILFNAEGSLLADTGRRQKAMIARMLFGVDTGSAEVTMSTMVRRLKGHLRGGNPLYLLITSVNSENADRIATDLKELKGVGGKRSKVIVLNINAYDLATRDQLEKMAARFMTLNQSVKVSRLRKEGWAVVDWDPSEQSVVKVVSRMSEAML